jgi:hypothetical protein
MRILIIEDEVRLQTQLIGLMRRIYGESNLVIDVTDSGEQAIELMSRFAYQLVTSDGNLASLLTGADVLTWVAKNQPWLVDRFCLISGNTAMIEETGHYRYIVKGEVNRATFLHVMALPKPSQPNEFDDDAPTVSIRRPVFASAGAV